MTPQAFIAHWQHNQITERAGAQQHFNDLCEMLGMEKPRDTENYCFERGAKIHGGQGWADVWKRGCFAWEYKAPNKDLNAALKQLMNYALALDNPPLLVVSDLRTIEIHTHFTGHPSEVHRIEIEQLTQPETLQKLRWLFEEPERFKPKNTTYAVTELAAKRIGEIATRLNQRGNAPDDVAHFLIQCVFCMFAEDAKLLPEKLFETVMDKSNPDGSKAQKRLSDLFNAMQSGGDFHMTDIPWFNGGLFKQINIPMLETADVVSLLDAARMDWSQIEPAILGTLFERGLNPDMRSQLGAHYTDPATIMKIIRPVIEQPLLAEWQPVKASIAENMQKYEAGGKGSKNAFDQAQQAFLGFLQRLRDFRVLDPACGSGNFLYLALKTLKDLEHRINIEAESLGLHRELNIETSPANVMGIEINPYAAELARVTVWIGEIQWMLSHGYQYRKDPILAPLDHIENRDAILNADGTEAKWPAVDAIVGNPPFLGQRFMLRELGETYARQLRKCYDGRVDGNADLVIYWFEKARAQIAKSLVKYAGLVSTNSIRGGANRLTLTKIIETCPVYDAWADETWVNAGAAVRVSLVCFGNSTQQTFLNGLLVSHINADLSSNQQLDLTSAQALPQNKSVAFSGFQMNGSFDVPIETALDWLKQPNPNGKSNIAVLHPYSNAKDITSRDRNQWVIDFTGIDEAEATFFEKPFHHVLEHVKPERELKNEAYLKAKYWLHKRSSPEMRTAIKGLSRFIATPMVSKYRLFVWLPESKIPENAAIVIARNDDTSFGILHSRFHEVWSLKMCTWMGKGNDPRYTPTTCFETFPFPQNLTPQDLRGSRSRGDANKIADDIASSAQRLNELRENWLNPTEWVDWVITPEEEKAGYPKRAVAKADFEDELKKRTLTKLYNQRPAWLDNAHKTLDMAVAKAYGWEDYTPEMPDDKILRRLLKLNLERSQ